MLKLKLQYFGYLMQRAGSLERMLMLGKIEGKRKRGWQRMSLLDSIIDSVDMNLSKLWQRVKDRGAWCAAVHGVAKSDQTWQLNNSSKLFVYRLLTVKGKGIVINCIFIFVFLLLMTFYTYQKNDAF